MWEVAGHVSPNPGGVGPLTRAFLLTNVVELAERQMTAQESVAVFAAQWPILLVGLIFVAAFVLVGGELLAPRRAADRHRCRVWRRRCGWCLSEDRAGLLVVRSKGIDFITTATVRAAMLYIASTIDPLGTR